jgi:hypothetical protein
MSRAIKTLKGVFLSAWGSGKATLLTVMVALTLATVTPAVAANGGNFLLGKGNLATAVTSVKGTVAGPALQVYNPSPSTAATAALFQVAAGHPPFKVNSATKVTNLNADKVDGQSFVCPAGTVFHEGACIQTIKRSFANVSDAYTDCVDEGKRLPTYSELTTFRNHFDFNSTEWTSAFSFDGTNFEVNTVDPQNISIQFSNGTLVNKLPYRCVVPPS